MLDERLQRTRITAADWTLGLAEAPIAVLEYGDFECPHCGAARPVLETLVFENPEAVRLVYRHFPVTSIHPHAASAAEAAEAAGAQGKFWQMHDLLFSRQEALAREDLEAYAAALDLDRRRFAGELAEQIYLKDVREDFRRGIEDGVNGTPTLFINGLRYDGPRTREAMLAAIAAQMRAWSQDHGLDLR